MGSEMCIRDRARHDRAARFADPGRASRGEMRPAVNFYYENARQGVQPNIECGDNRTIHREEIKMANTRIRIKLKAYEHNLIDQSAAKIVDTARRTGARVSGPIPLPTEKEIITILRAPHKYKDSREQFEQRTHKRLIDVLSPSQKTVDALSKLEMPAGVFINLKVMN